MARLKSGDRVNCRLKASLIISPYKDDYDDERVFEIIASDEEGYYLYVPPYFTVKNSDKVDYHFARKLGIDSKFIGEEIIHISDSLVSRVNSTLDGCFCIKCKDFCEMAAPNQPDGTLICWHCRTYPSWH